MFCICQHCAINKSGHRQQPSSIQHTLTLCLLTLLNAIALTSAHSGAALGSDTWREAASRKSLRDSVMQIRKASSGSINAEGPTFMSPHTTPPGYPELDVLDCMRESSPHVPATVDDFKAARPARLTPELALFSSAQRTLDVTVVTAFSMSRLYMLDGMCAGWQGPLSAAVYQGLLTSTQRATFNRVQKAKAEVLELFTRIEARGACQLDIVLYSEVMASQELVDVLYPINALRNAALLMARTELIFNLDGDMVISGDLSEALTDPARLEEVRQQCNARNFMVIPAFDTKNETLAYASAVGGKESSMSAFASGSLFPFLKGQYEPAHAPTNFTRWYTAGRHYDIEYSDGFEPWGVVSRHLTPFFDVRFRGYGKNKIQYLRLLNSLGFGYTVNADSFIVHRPHVSTKAKDSFAADHLANLRKPARNGLPSNGGGHNGVAHTQASKGTEQEMTVRRRSLEWNRVRVHQNAATGGNDSDETSTVHRTTGINERNSSARRQLAGAATNVQLFNVTNGFYGDFLGELRRGTYEILVTEGFERCRQQLPWWRDYRTNDTVLTRVVHPDGNT